MNIYRDSARSVDERVDDLVAQMTLEEKLAQLGSFWIYEVLDGLTLAPEKARRLMGHGIGHVTRLGGASNLKPRQAAELANAIQKFLIDNTRLKIPAIVHEECCSGYMAFGATVFPQAVGVASTWEPELVEAMASVIRRQMRSVGGHHALAPVLDVTRDARWGRVEETFGEDPYLVARMGSAYIKGLQGHDPRAGIVATGKHFVGYGMSEGGMNWAPPHIAPRELREIYLYPFEAAVREAGLASIMNGYHELDGVPCAANRELLTEILRDQWGFDGTVVSDYFAVNMLFEYHRLADDKAGAARLALETGIDIELPSTDCYGEPLRRAVESGAIPVSLVDVAVRRVLTQKFALGLFENPFVDAGQVRFDTPEDRQLARHIAQKSIVLLKNDGNLLPLAKGVRSIAVIGPNADSTRNLFGDYAYPAHIESLQELKETGSFSTPVPDKITLERDFIPAISVLEAIRRKVGAQTVVHYAQGCGTIDPSRAGFAEAVEAANKSDLVVMVMGDKAGLIEGCTSGEGNDRASLDLPGVQADLVYAIYETGKPIVLVLLNGRPVTFGWMNQALPAILVAWFPGEEGGDAIADVLFGDVNPGGKLPISFPRSVGQLPVYYGHKPSGGRSHWKGKYVELETTPQYPFGYGLSYTTFQYADLQLDRTQAQSGEVVAIRVQVSNTGGREGDEVVQLYTRNVRASVTRPLKELRGFKRLTLKPGETRTLTFHLPVNQLAYYTRAMDFGIEPGPVEVMVGSSSSAIHLRGSFTITGQAAKVSDRVFLCPVSVG